MKNHRRLAPRAGLVVWSILLLLSLSTLRAEDNSSAAAAEARLREAAGYLAGDALEGRGVGTKGLDQAADFLAAGFTKLGLKTDLYEGTPFQKFKVTTSVELGPKEQNKLTLIGPPAKAGESPQRIDMALGKDFTPLAAGGSGKLEAPLVFVGYGISAKDLPGGSSYDEYAGLNVQGKIVILIRKEPQQENKDSVFDGVNPSRYALFQAKFANAFEHGAAAVLVVNDRLEVRNQQESEKKAWLEALDKLAEARKSLQELKEPTPADREKLISEIGKRGGQIAELSPKVLATPDSLLPFTGAGMESSHRQMPILCCTRAALDRIVTAVVGKNLAAIEQEIDGDLKPRGCELTGWSAACEAQVLQKEVEVKNVVAVLEGEGPLADETIVIGAHYDHLGHGGPGSLAPWTSEIHNGADDNASGAATLLELAQRLATQGKKPRRRIVFLAFTGEERGLLGSEYYVKNPRFPLEKTIAMFNLDMVGRLQNDKLMVYGTGTSSLFDPLIEGLTKKLGFQLTKHPGGFGPSDHSSFYAKKIPVLHFFTGTHSDYHRPSDDTDKLNIAGMRRVADLVAEVILATDAAEQRPDYIAIKTFEGLELPKGGGDRPSLGTIPSYSSNAVGVELSGVVPGGPPKRPASRKATLLSSWAKVRSAALKTWKARCASIRRAKKSS